MKCNRCGKPYTNIFYRNSFSLSSNNLQSQNNQRFSFGSNQGNSQTFNNQNFSNSFEEENNYMNKNISFSPIITRIPKENKKQKNMKRYVGREGDWICHKCNNLNFSFRNVCNRCGISKTENDNIQRGHK